MKNSNTNVDTQGMDETDRERAILKDSTYSNLMMFSKFGRKDMSGKGWYFTTTSLCM